MKTRHGISALAAACAVGLAVAQPPPVMTNVPPQFDTNAEPKVIQPAQINLSPALAEVVRLAQSGAEESVIITYIQKAPPYSVSADEIVYLQDLGIPDPVIKAVVEHGKAGAAATTPPAATTNVPPVPEPTRVTQTSAPPVTATAAPPAAVVEFYEPLAPYGSWIIVEPYGWCWQPNVVVVNTRWSPYFDNGYWLWSDSGWYWHSYYSWGWAPFHYGRWFHHPYRRWVWVPDRVWGPSWVCWRESPGYYGWAPLPPGAHFSVGIGWTFGGRHVGPDFAFGLSTAHFTFVAGRHFTDRHLARHRLHHRDADVVFKNTTIINNYTVGSGNRIINRGVERSRVEATTGTRIREVAVRELPRDSARAASIVPDRVTKVAGSDVVYRPGPQIQMPRYTKPTAAGQRQALTRPDAPVHDDARGRQPSATAPRQGVYAQPRTKEESPAAPRQVTPARPVTPTPSTRTVPAQPQPPRQVTPAPSPSRPAPAPAQPPPSPPPQGRQKQDEKAGSALLPRRNVYTAPAARNEFIPRQQFRPAPRAGSVHAAPPQSRPRAVSPSQMRRNSGPSGGIYTAPAYGSRAPAVRGATPPSQGRQHRGSPENRRDR